MPVIKDFVHPRGLDFRNQRRVVMLRSMQPPMAFKRIAEQVRNLQKEPSTEDVVRRVFARFRPVQGRATYKYASCGRKPWKLTREVGAFLLRTLRTERARGICTSQTLQAATMQALRVQLSASAIRKYLARRGYKWLPRSQKRKYGAAMRRERLAFASTFEHMTHTELRRHVCMAMDGVVLTVPPADPIERKNYCLHGETHMWRKRGESAAPSLAGNDPYADQVPVARALPLWGAISANGFKHVVYHRQKKLKVAEWASVLRAGALTRAADALQARGGRSPRRIICDNERFLTAAAIRPAYIPRNLQLLQIPKRSPDLNPH